MATARYAPKFSKFVSRLSHAFVSVVFQMGGFVDPSPGQVVKLGVRAKRLSNSQLSLFRDLKNTGYYLKSS